MKELHWIFDVFDDAAWLWRSDPTAVCHYEFKIKIRQTDRGKYYYTTFYSGRYMIVKSLEYDTLEEAKDAATIHVTRFFKVLSEV